jgi:hypothetical protein
MNAVVVQVRIVVDKLRGRSTMQSVLKYNAVVLERVGFEIEILIDYS